MMKKQKCLSSVHLRDIFTEGNNQIQPSIKPINKKGTVTRIKIFDYTAIKNLLHETVNNKRKQVKATKNINKSIIGRNINDNKLNISTYNSVKQNNFNSMKRINFSSIVQKRSKSTQRRDNEIKHKEESKLPMIRPNSINSSLEKYSFCDTKRKTNQRDPIVIALQLKNFYQFQEGIVKDTSYVFGHYNGKPFKCFRKPKDITNQKIKNKERESFTHRRIRIYDRKHCLEDIIKDT